jgi:tetratricopeptide (TPR) repeat protein
MKKEKKLKNKNNAYVVAFVIASISSLILNACSSSSTISQTDNPNPTPYEIYSIVNKIDTNTEYYIKNHYLFDLLINASKNEQLGQYQYAVVDLLEALRYDSSNVILYSIAKNLYYLEKYQLSFDYSFKSYLLDSSFIPNINLIVATLMELYRTKEAIYFSTKLLSLKGETANENDIERHVYLLEKYDTTFTKALQFCQSIPSTKRTRTILLNMIRYYEYKNDTLNEIVALENYLKSINKDTKNPSTLHKLLGLLLTQNRYEQFFDDFNNFATSLDCSEIFEILSSYTKHFSTAETKYSQFSTKLIDRINKLCTDDVITDLLSAKIYYSIGDSAKALTYEAKILERNDLDMESLVRITEYLFSNNKRREIFQLMNRLEKKFALEPSFQTVKGQYYLMCDSLERAKESLELALQLDSTSSFIYSNLGWLYYELGENAMSDSFYTKALELAPNAIISNNFAYSLIERGVRLDYAKQLIEFALMVDPKNPYYLDTYGWLFYRLGNYDLAIKYISESIQIDGTNAETYIHLGEIYQTLGNIDLAHKYYEKAKSIAPNDLKIIHKLQELTK